MVGKEEVEEQADEEEEKSVAGGTSGSHKKTKKRSLANPTQPDKKRKVQAAPVMPEKADEKQATTGAIMQVGSWDKVDGNEDDRKHEETDTGNPTML